MSGFSIEWLNLREASDHRARDRHLLKTAANWLNDLKSKDKVIAELTGVSPFLIVKREVLDNLLILWLKN